MNLEELRDDDDGPGIMPTGFFSSRLPTICPTRWTVRIAAIQSLLGKYGAVIITLWELAENWIGEAAVKARGLHDQLEKGAMYLRLLMSKEILSVTDGLSVACNSTLNN